MPPKRKTAAKKKEELVVEVAQAVDDGPQQPFEDPEYLPIEVDNEEHVVLQLPILSDRLNELTYVDTILEYNPSLPDPTPYNPLNQFVSDHDMVEAANDTTVASSSSVAPPSKESSSDSCDKKVLQKCFWCCHDVGHEIFGMPIRYDALNKNFAMYGTFCSLECASAFNFAQHLGSDRAWEIHSWIQMLGRRFGYKEPIRPAPSRYLLEMFGGPLSIDDFRNAHKGQARIMVMNIPPLISVPSQMEMINTSFIGTEKKKKPAVVEKPKRTIDTKMKLLIQDDSS